MDTNPAEVLDTLDGFFDTVEPMVRQILLERVLAQNPKKLQELGDEFEVSREWIRQREVNAKRRFQSWLEHPEAMAVSLAAIELTETFGGAFPAEHAVLEQFKPYQDLLLWLAGPYVQVDEWFLHADYKTQLEKFYTRLCNRHPNFISSQELEDFCNSHEIKPEVRDAWVEKTCTFYEVSKGYIPWHGSVGARLYRLLKYVDRPLSWSEVRSKFQEFECVRSLKTNMTRHPEVVRVSLHHFGLREWGVGEYSSIVDLIRNELEAAGKPIKRSDLAEKLRKKWSVSYSAVYTLANVPLFIIENGYVRIRQPNDPPFSQGNRPIDEVPELEYVDGKLTLFVEVDKDLLRGSGPHTHPTLGYKLGVTPGKTKVFNTLWGKFHIRWRITAPIPTLSSLRAIAQGLEAVVGDTLAFQFRGEGCFVYKVDSDAAHAA